MKWKRWVILVLVLGLGAYGVARFVSWRRSVAHAQHQRDLAHQNDPDAAVRLAALDGLIRRDAAADHLRIRRAETLMEMHRHVEARNELQSLLDGNTPQVQRVLTLQIESFLAEADRTISETGARQAGDLLGPLKLMSDELAGKIELLAGGVATIRTILFDARRLDMLAAAHRLALEGKHIDLAEARLAENLDAAERLGYAVESLRAEVRGLDEQLAAQCQEVLRLDPSNSAPHQVLFHMHLRRGDFAAARNEAARLASLTAVARAIVARVADTLLDLEMRFAEPVTEADIELAGRLLRHPKQTGDVDGLMLTVARAAYALATGDAAHAEALAYGALRDEPYHSRLRALVAMARIAQGRPREAIGMVEKYTEFEQSSRVRYALGAAYFATGLVRDLPVARETLRQAVELDPSNLPARLLLIETLVRSGHVIDAAGDIDVARDINPRHPRVVELSIELAVARGDPGAIATIIDQHLTEQRTRIGPQNAAIVALMALDDVRRARELADEFAKGRPADVIVMLCRAWSQLDALRRPRIAPVVVRSALAHMDRDPLMRPTPPPTPPIGFLAEDKANLAVTTEGMVDSLTSRYFVRDPLDAAYELTVMATDRWPLDLRLPVLAAELALWLDRPAEARQWLSRRSPGLDAEPTPLVTAMRALLDDNDAGAAEVIASLSDAAEAPPPTLRWIELALAVRNDDDQRMVDSLRRLLREHPWAERALIMLVADAAQRDQPDRAFALIGGADLVNPLLGHLTRARLYLAMGKPAEAKREIDQLVRDEAASSEVRRWAAEVKARAHLGMEQLQLAVGTFDQLVIGLTDHRLEAQIGAVDVLLAAGREHGAAEVITTLVAPADNPPRLTDQLLARAMITKKPASVRAIIDKLLTYRTDEPVLLLYQARVIALTDTFSGERILRDLLVRQPGSPRVLMTLAELSEPFQPDEAIRIYKGLMEQGGTVGAAARRAFERLTGTAARQEEFFFPFLLKGPDG